MKRILWGVVLTLVASVSFAACCVLKPIVSLGIAADAPLYSHHPQYITLVVPHRNIYNTYSTGHVYTDPITTQPNSSLGGMVSLMGTGFLGVEVPLSSLYAWQIGLAYYQMGPYMVNGRVHRFVSVDNGFRDLNYNFQVQTLRLMVETKLMGTWKQTFHPYITGDLGAASNRASNYQEFRLDPNNTTPTGPLFPSNTRGALTGSLGAGGDLDICQDIRIGFKYLHSWFGSASLGLVPNQPNRDRLFLPSITSNEFILQGTYFF